MPRFFLAFLLLFLFQDGIAQHPFYWKWQVVQQQLIITGKKANGSEKKITVGVAVTKKRFEKLYDIIEEIAYSKMQAYQRTVDTLSDELVLPFADEIDAADAILIEIDSSLLRFPIEFLKIKQLPVAIAKPLLFTISGSTVNENADSIQLHKGYIIRDASSDPDNACLATLQKYPASQFKNAHKITEKDLTLQPGIDFILISAHGTVDNGSLRGGIALNKIDNVASRFLAENNPRIVYIDACQQGINWTYISALCQTHFDNFYIGPIISNDSGESSTKTINWFFGYLQQLYNPVTALWKTRVKLFQHYNKQIKQMDVINKSFIFRVYKV